MPAGRPSKFKPEFIEQAKKLAALGATDKEIADFFEVGRDEDEFLWFALQLIREDRNGVIAARKRVRSESRAKRMQSPSERLLNAMRARIWAALKGRSDGRLYSRLGYTQHELIKHLQSMFRDGMDWKNYGKWHVDHIKPCAMFDMSDPAQFAECWALSNLQPLWAHENVKKGAKYGAA